MLGLENVQVVLSGMSDMEQAKDNINTFDESLPLSAEEEELLMKACRIHHKTVAVTCTACRYCCTDCPMGLDIPFFLKLYNEYKLGGKWRLTRLAALEEEKRPGACIGCGSCTSHCPQSLDVPAMLHKLAEDFATL